MSQFTFLQREWPNAEGKGLVDCVLWGNDGKPIGLVEAKRTRRDPRAGQQQAKLYADCLERQFAKDAHREPTRVPQPHR